jgi:hypothetical protein
MSTIELTGRRAKIQSAWDDWKLETSTHSLSDGIYSAVLEREDDFEGLQHAIDKALLDWASDRGQDFVEVVYWAIEAAQRSATSPPWDPNAPRKVGALPYSISNSGL